MDDEMLNNIGWYLITIISAFMVFGVFMIGHAVNGIIPELATMFAAMLGATEGIMILIIKKLFKIKRVV